MQSDRTENRIAVMPFGAYEGVLLSEIRTSYFPWALANLKLSPGLRQALGDELRRRGGTPPPAPPPRPAPTCTRCGPDAGVSYSWLRDSLGRLHIRARCAGCDAGLGCVSQTEPFLSLAGPAPERITP
jgi:hypothetical protein